MDKRSQLIFNATLFVVASNAWSSDLEIPNIFVSGEAAVAVEVNENFDNVETAVDDNNQRLGSLEDNVSTNNGDIGALQAAITDLTSRVEALEQDAPVTLAMETHYATDDVILIYDGVRTIPGTTGSTNNAFEFYPLPGLGEISFEIAEDNTLVLFQANGRVAPGLANEPVAYELALVIDGEIPATGANLNQRVETVHAWQIYYPVMLDAGSHTFSVSARRFETADANILEFSGQSDEGYTKATLVKLHVPE